MTARAEFDPVTLRLFIAACEEGNISRAAMRESVVPSAVSKRLSALAQELGVELLKRGGSGVVPTAAGETMLRRSREILATMQHARAEMQDYTTGVSGNVRLLASSSVLSDELPADIGTFLTKFGTARVSLEERVSAEIVRSIRDGSADLGICWDAAPLRELFQVEYRTDQAVVVVHAMHPLAGRTEVRFDELLDHEQVCVMPGSVIHTLFEAQARLGGKSPRYRAEVSNFDTACRIVHANLGLAILPMQIASRYAPMLDLRILTLRETWAHMRFVICAAAEAQLSATARLLLNHLVESSRLRLSAPPRRDPSDACASR